VSVFSEFRLILCFHKWWIKQNAIVVHSFSLCMRHSREYDWLSISRAWSTLTHDLGFWYINETRQKITCLFYWRPKEEVQCKAMWRTFVLLSIFLCTSDTVSFVNSNSRTLFDVGGVTEMCLDEREKSTHFKKRSYFFRVMWPAISSEHSSHRHNLP